MTLDDMFQSVKATLYDRVSSPLWGAFLLSWIAWNYRMLIVLFSSMSPDEKFEYIGNVLYFDWTIYAIYWGLAPLATAIIVIGVIPFFGEKAYRVSRFWKVRLKTAKLEYDGKTPMSQDEVNQVLLKAVEEKRNLEAQIVTAVKETEKVQGHLEVSVAEKIDLSRKVSSLEATLDSARKRVEELELALQPNKMVSPDEKLRKILINGDFELVYNAVANRAKRITFNENGDIGDGRNDNEYRWDVEDDELLIYTHKDELHNQFAYQKDTGQLTAVTDVEVKALPNQIIVPAHTV